MNNKNLSKHLEEEHNISSAASYLKEIVYGATDGIITTFAVVSGFSGANSGPYALNFSLITVLIFGLANLIADGASMGLGNFLSLKSERKVYEDFYKKEMKETKDSYNDEIEETRLLLEGQGFEPKDASILTNLFSKNPKFWVKFMVQHEGGINDPENESPIKSGFITFFSFIVFGSIPLIPYIFLNNSSYILLFIISIIFTLSALALLGGIRAYVSKSSFIISIFETVLLGGVASALAYSVGYIFTL
tara:strand:- start:475 stop:1218 length:744 start_codon:yes stop_codon:yes gene_type:complete